MEDNRPKKILDSTFRHLEQVLEEMRRERTGRKRFPPESRPENLKEEKKGKQPKL